MNLKIDLHKSGIEEMYELYGKNERHSCGTCYNLVGIKCPHSKAKKCLAHEVEYGLEKLFYPEDVACGHHGVRPQAEEYPMFQPLIDQLQKWPP